MLSWTSLPHSSRLLVLSLLFPVANAMWPFPPKRFTGNSLLEAGSLGLGDDGRVVAFGDFNGDQFLDVLTLGSDDQTLTVHLWNHDAFFFRNAASFRHPQRVYNVVPGDFTHDGTLDILVMGRGASSSLEMALYVGDSGNGFDTAPLSVPPSSLAQPIPLDANGDLKIDLLGMPTSTSSIKLWKNVFNLTDSHSAVFEVVDAPLINKGPQCTISDPHSNAVVDLNGDCLADIFLTCNDGKGAKYFQIWVNEKSAGFSLAQQGSLPSGIQSISFADMDRDGTVDMVFITCPEVSTATGIGTDCSLNVAYNKQLPLCTTSATSGLKKGKRICRPPEQLCTADPDFRFDLRESADNDAFVRVPITHLMPQSAPSLLVLDTTSSPPLPIAPKLGDANLDGFPDLLLIAASSPHGGFLGIGDKADLTPKLLYSVPCAVGVAGCGPKGEGRRGWKVVKNGAEMLSGIKDARGAAFLDLDEDGTLDIMVQRTGAQGQGKTSFVQNNFFYDAFFLKAIVLNGACDNGWCTRRNSTEQYHPFGVSYSGASYKYTVLDTSGRRSAAQVGQLPQTSYQSLLTPYSFFGLGRTNNYIENLFVGSTKQSEEHFINMEGVIPNSKVVIYPPPGTEDGTWRRELYLRPGEWIPWVTLTVVVATIILAVIVLVLHWNEKREDELERRRASHHINFDAL